MLLKKSLLTINAAFEPASGYCPNKLESCEPTWPISPTHPWIFHRQIVATRHFDIYSPPSLRLPPGIQTTKSVGSATTNIIVLVLDCTLIISAKYFPPT